MKALSKIQHQWFVNKNIIINRFLVFATARVNNDGNPHSTVVIVIETLLILTYNRGEKSILKDD